MILIGLNVFGMNRCKRLNSLGLNSLVLAKASPRIFSIRAKDWSESAHRFLKQCADAGNVEACYTLGMVSSSDDTNGKMKKRNVKSVFVFCLLKN